MRKIVTIQSLKFTGILMLFLVNLQPLFSQNPIYPKAIKSKYFVTPIKNIKLPATYKYSGYHLAWGKQNAQLILYGSMKNGQIIFIEKVPHRMPFYPKNFVRAAYNGKTKKVELCSRQPGQATIFCGLFSIENDELTYIKTQKIDLSALQTKRGFALLNQNKPMAALAVFDSVQYAEKYFDIEKVAGQLFEKCIPYWEGKAERRQIDEILKSFTQLMQFKGWHAIWKLQDSSTFYQFINNNPYNLKAEKFIGYIYKQFVWANSRRKFKFVKTQYKKWIKRLGHTPEMLLAKANQLYNERQREASKKYYKRYIVACKQLGRKKEITPRIEYRAK